MNQILNINQAVETAKILHDKNKTIVLAGGCFDILHIGHMDFLEKAKKRGDILFLFLESDEKIKQLKGNQRPIFDQMERAKVLSALKFVDYIILLPEFKKNEEYDTLIKNIKPNIIAVTKNDPNIKHIKRQIKLVSAKIAIVNSKIKNVSSSNILSKIADLWKKFYF